LLLASASPTRKSLLEAAGLPVETAAAAIDERAIEAEMADQDSPGFASCLAARLAREKALAVSRRSGDRVVVGADQTLVCEGRLFHTPSDREAAAAQLARLSGRSHSLYAAFAIARGGEVLESGGEAAELTMRPLDAETIARYLGCAGAQAVASVGAYQIEKLGIHLFARIEGQHSTILGLPLLPLLAGLRKLGLLAF